VHHLPKVSGPADMGAFDAPNTYLVEGRIAATGRLARGIRDAGPEQWRFIGKLAAAALAVIVAVGFATWILGIIFS
jgi:hypothetical protein